MDTCLQVLTIKTTCYYHRFKWFDFFKDSLSPSPESLEMWTEQLQTEPRATSLLVGSHSQLAQNPVIKLLSEAVKSYTGSVKLHYVKREKRDPEFTFYDAAQTTMNAYRVKPAVFDLVLSLCIAGYLGLVYLVRA